jgi:gliding motility-associated GldL-like protein
MYCISEEQIDFILSDISARGIEMESLQQNLLDHICCVIEHDLDEDGDFESFYSTVIASFYKVELREIEEETINLLIHKNYYIMKKIMMVSGTFSASILSLGILFKFMHWPGAAMMIQFGIVLLSFVFLPLMFVLKAKEKPENSDKVVVGIATLCAMLISVGILFKIMHWPFANILVTSALLIMMFLFIPIYFFSGIRNPQTKVNTMVSTILLIAGCGLILTLVRAPAGSKLQQVSDTGYFFRNETILKTEARQVAQWVKGDVTSSENTNHIYKICEDLKGFLLDKETGFKQLDADFETKNALLTDSWATDYLKETSPEMKELEELKNLITNYNQTNSNKPNFQEVQVTPDFFEGKIRVKQYLNELNQIQMVLLQNQRELVAIK